MQVVKFGKCKLCDQPGVGAINANANAGAGADPIWEVRCAEHNPYWNPRPDPELADRLFNAAKRALDVHDEPCRPDHNGLCQSHNLDPVDSCWVRELRDATAAYWSSGGRNRVAVKRA